MYLWGHWDNAYATTSTFTPVNGDVTFASTAATSKYLKVDFTTNASWDDVNDTIDFNWAREDAYGDFNGFAIVSVSAAPIPEPMTMLAVGLGITSLGGYIRKRRRA